MHIGLNVVADHEALFNIDTCNEGQRIEKNRKNICLELYKCSLKWFFKKNNVSSYKLSKKKKKEKKKRKFQTFN